MNATQTFSPRQRSAGNELELGYLGEDDDLLSDGSTALTTTTKFLARPLHKKHISIMTSADSRESDDGNEKVRSVYIPILF